MNITSLDKFPTEKHYAALVFKTTSVHHEGDERSRTNPGHGYPAYTETIHGIDYIHFINQADMLKWVAREGLETYNKKQFQIVEVIPINVGVTTTAHIVT